jgi:hypothetical protein
VPRVWGQAAAAERPAVADQAVQIVRHLEASGYEGLEVLTDPNPDPNARTSDLRWSLWRDLREKASQAEGWQPVVVRRVFDVSSSGGLCSDRVEVSFDHRLSQAAVMASIRRLWPRLSTAGWVRSTKTMEKRADSLIRFVCLGSVPDTPWRSMLDTWNATFPHEWKHKHVRDFTSRFHRAEEQLTGVKRGLEWFYDTGSRAEAWANVTLAELEDLAAGGRRLPVPLWQRIRQMGKAAGLASAKQMTEWSAQANRLAGQGLSPEKIHTRMVSENPDWARFTGNDSVAKAVSFVERELLSDPEQWQRPDFDLGTWKSE